MAGLVRSFSERPLITGDSLEVRFPNTRANQWTSGLVALEDGWLLPLNRSVGWYRPDGAMELRPKTEVFSSAQGASPRSLVLAGEWLALDYHPDHGVLLAGTRPVPHFVRVPAAALRPPPDGG